MFDWLESKTVSTLFTCAAWGVGLFIAVVILGTTPWIHQIEAFPAGKFFLLVLCIGTVAISATAMLIIIFGMAIFCAFRDRSSVGTKILWFLFFFFTAPLGSMVYFLTVYKKHLRTCPSAGGHGPTGLSQPR